MAEANASSAVKQVQVAVESDQLTKLAQLVQLGYVSALGLILTFLIQPVLQDKNTRFLRLLMEIVNTV